jgi:class 3 adenylate cyclase/tetratricopeptide (TPR) repeat protein
MTTPCPSCGAELPEAARFCPSCGRQLDQAADEERRVVTVVFADLAGFTALSEGRDPEAVKELLDGCFGALVPVIELHGGHVDKIIGDELMAVFGAPVAHEDDPERAVRAAFGLLAALQELDPELVLRVGINTGEVLAGPVGPSGAYTVTGDAVNTAHRLVSVAERGAILCGERTWMATQDVISYDERPPYKLRGKQEPVRAWAATGTLGAPGQAASWGAGEQSPFVGRDGVLRQLATMARDTFDRRSPFVVAVTGEAGIGKTRLALAIDHELADIPHHTLVAACAPYGRANPVEPIAGLVRTALGVDPDVHVGAQRLRVANAVPALARSIGADADLLGKRVTELLGLDRSPLRTGGADAGPTRARVIDELFAAGRLILEATATDRPTLVIVDDVHWADEALLAFLELLPHRMGAVPLFVVAAAREEVLERRPRLARGDEGVTPFPIGPLPDQAARALLASLLSSTVGAPGEVVVGPETERRLLNAAGGNPLLLEEVVRYLDDAGGISHDSGQVQITFDLDEAPLPDGVRALIGARLDGLPPDERRYLLDAAVVGSQFWSDAVVAIGDHPDPQGTAHTLLQKGLIERPRDSTTGDLGFRHVLTRDVAYASLPIGERAGRHAAMARWIEDSFPEDTDGPMVRLIAHHYDRAVMLGRELEHTDPGLAGAAFRALVHAAQEADRHEVFREAEHWYARALALGSLDRGAMLTATLAYGLALVRLHRLDEARGQFEVIRRDAWPDHPALHATATGRLAAAARLQGDTDGARQWFDDALRRWRELGDVDGEAETLRLQGWAELTVGRPRAALPRLLRAADLERGGPAGRESADTLRCLGWCEFLVGHFDQARSSLWEAALRFGDDGDLGAMAWCWGILAFTFLQSGDFDRATEIAMQMDDLARSQGDTWSAATCQLLISVAKALQGELVDGDALATGAQRMFREIDDVWGLAMVSLARGIIARLNGDWPAARSHLLTGLESARRIEWVAEEARLLTELATVEAQAGNLPEATRRARAALALVRAGIGDHESELRALCLLGELAWIEGDAAAAQLLLEEAAGPLGPLPDTTTLGWSLAQSSLARLLTSLGDLAEARTRAEQALAAARGSIEARDRANAALTDIARLTSSP